MLIGPLNGGNGLMRNSSMMKYSVTVVDLQKFQKNQEKSQNQLNKTVLMTRAMNMK